MKMDKLGEWAFIAGVIIAVVAAFVGIPMVTAALVVLGLLVGFLNVTEKETTSFLVAAIALIAAGTVAFGGLDSVIPGIGTLLNNIVGNIAVFVAPAAILVALKAVWAMAKK